MIGDSWGIGVTSTCDKELQPHSDFQVPGTYEGGTPEAKASP
jgi:hypothetical protein